MKQALLEYNKKNGIGCVYNVIEYKDKLLFERDVDMYGEEESYQDSPITEEYISEEIEMLSTDEDITKDEITTYISQLLSLKEILYPE